MLRKGKQLVLSQYLGKLYLLLFCLHFTVPHCPYISELGLLYVRRPCQSYLADDGILRAEKFRFQLLHRFEALLPTEL